MPDTVHRSNAAIIAQNTCCGASHPYILIEKSTMERDLATIVQGANPSSVTLASPSDQPQTANARPQSLSPSTKTRVSLASYHPNKMLAWTPLQERIIRLEVEPTLIL